VAGLQKLAADGRADQPRPPDDEDVHI
jgi:hypothetical protein